MSELGAWLGPLRRYVGARVPGPDGEDLVQEILLRVHQGLPSLREPARAPGFVFAVARRVLIDHHRRARRGLPPLPDPPEGEAEDPVHAQLGRCLEPLLASLPAAQQQALRASELAGRSQTAAAAALGLPLPTLKAQVQRGRRRLREAFARCCTLELDARGHVMSIEPGPACAC